MKSFSRHSLSQTHIAQVARPQLSLRQLPEYPLTSRYSQLPSATPPLLKGSVVVSSALHTRSTTLVRTPPYNNYQTQLHPHTSQQLLKGSFSTTSYLVLIGLLTGFLGASYFVSESTERVEFEETQDQQEDFTMASQNPEGRPGNLTPEQEEKLRKLWEAIFQLCGVLEAKDTTSADVSGSKEVVSAEPDTPKKKRFGMFRKNHKDDKSSVSPKDAAKDGGEDDKYGQTKQFHETLANHSPETIRQTIWSMVKHDHPDALVLRFLRARKWDVEKALVMLVSTMNWRHSEMHVDDDIMKNGEAGALDSEKNGDGHAKQLGQDFLAQVRMGKSFLHGLDKNGRPICYVRVRLHKQGEQCEESLERYTVYLIETARMVLSPPVDTATIVFDMTGFSMANMDYTPVKFMIKCFEANYPESLGAVLVHNAPWVFQGIWKIIRGWLDPVVAGKVHFTNNKTELEDYIPPSQMIKELGGDEAWQYEYVEPIAGENVTMEDTKTRDQLLVKREELVKKFEAATLEWINGSGGEKGDLVMAQRTALAKELREDYWRLDPYIRARSLYDRQGFLQLGGKVDWYRKEVPKTVAETSTDDLD